MYLVLKPVHPSGSSIPDSDISYSFSFPSKRKGRGVLHFQSIQVTCHSLYLYCLKNFRNFDKKKKETKKHHRIIYLPQANYFSIN